MARSSDIEKWAGIVLGNFKLMEDVKKRCLVVEGSTDETVLSKYVRDDVYCCSVNKKKSCNDVFFSEKSPQSEQDHESCKNAITTLINCVYNFPNVFNWPKGFMSVPVYGLIDKDFDNYEDYLNATGLAVTYTHDLETLLIATAGESILTELGGGSVKETQVNDAFLLAYQLALLRIAVNQYNTSDRGTTDRAEAARQFSGRKDVDEENSAPHVQLRWLRGKDGTVHFEEFTDGIVLNAARALEYILNQQNDEMLNTIRRRIRNGVFRYLDGLLDKDGTFRLGNLSATPADEDNFFDVVNGHDIMSALAFLNPKVNSMYSRVFGNGLNRNMEFALIKSYTIQYYEYFSDNPTYKRLLSMDIVKEIHK